ncbi:MAG: S8 family serine peptidase [Acidobacteria bacterium]|jgi:subtilisin family serine protease|nr:S8 family serine peptidase [Acidobacteriota bacterium]
MILSAHSLPPRTGRGVRIAVVDSGIHAAHPHVGGISGGVGIGPLGELSDDYVDRLGHGTAVAAAIREKAPKCELLSVRVFDRTLTTTGLALVAAIEWAALQGVHLINLSLGASNQEHAPALAAAVAKAAARGAIVVSAAPQEGAAWLPGGLHGVVAVDVDWDCPREECRVVSADAGGIRLTASGYPRPIPGVAPERNFSGLSFAVANVTGLLALTLEDRPAQTVAALADRLRD